MCAFAALTVIKFYTQLYSVSWTCNRCQVYAVDIYVIMRMFNWQIYQWHPNLKVMQAACVWASRILYFTIFHESFVSKYFIKYAVFFKYSFAWRLLALFLLFLSSFSTLVRWPLVLFPFCIHGVVQYRASHFYCENTLQKRGSATQRRP